MAIPTVNEIEPNNTIATATPTGLVQGTIGIARGLGAIATSSTGDFDFYTVPVAAAAAGGQVITARAISLSGLDTVLDVFDPSGALVASNDDAGGSLDSFVQFAPTTVSGNYTVRVRSFASNQPDPTVATGTAGSSTGQYEIFINTDRTFNATQGAATGDAGFGEDDTPNLVFGGAGADTISGAGGDDAIEGGTGADVLAGGAGDDFFVIRTGDLAAGDTISGDTGTDAVQYIYGLAGGGTATINATGAGFTITDATGNVAVSTVEGVGFQGRAGDDTLTLTGTFAGTGVGSLTGANATSSILFLAGDGNDTLNGGSAGTGVQFLVDGGTGNDVLTGGAGNDLFIGGLGNDSLTGGAGNDVLFGGAGADTMVGGTGDDIYIVDDNTDTIIESAGEGNDTVLFNTAGAFNISTFANIESFAVNSIATGDFAITGSFTDDNIVGGAGNDSLDGGAGRDFLSGGAGNDVITGGSGNDYLTGGAGSDTFVETGSFGFDTIADFQAGNGGDVLRVSGFTSFAQVRANLFQVDADGIGGANDVQFIQDNANAVNLIGVNINNLTANNFQFV